jgi:hypothetical protein
MTDPVKTGLTGFLCRMAGENIFVDKTEVISENEFLITLIAPTHISGFENAKARQIKVTLADVKPA